MSAQPSSGAAASKTADAQQPAKAVTKTTALEEDDEFEDFPVEDWPADQDISSQPPPTTTTSSDGMKTEGESGGGRGAAPLHLWEESWDDDEGDAAGGEFAAQLKAEMGRK